MGPPQSTSDQRKLARAYVNIGHADLPESTAMTLQDVARDTVPATGHDLGALRGLRVS